MKINRSFESMFAVVINISFSFIILVGVLCFSARHNLIGQYEWGLDPSASSGGLCLRMRSSRSRFERCSAVISTGNCCFPKYHLQPLTRVEPQRENDVPVVYGAMDGSGDLFKDAVQSECSCRFV